MDDIITKQGWSDATLLELALEYIANQGDDDAFAEFLERKAEEENTEDG